MRSFRFEAAHWLPHTPAGHKCRRVHGHSFEVAIEVSGQLQMPYGWVCDFADIDEAWQPIHADLDHRQLNDVDGLENPTSELLAAWIWSRLAADLPGLSAVEVGETCSAKCTYRAP